MSLQTTDNATSPRTWALIVWGLFIASYFTFAATLIVAVIIAYVKRGDLVGTPFASHMTSAIRTFWISLIASVIGVVLLLIGIGVFILGAAALWQLFRTIRGVIRALDNRPIDDPEGWF
ncbi:DUF4870 domain-containing protein [Bradyrhizobium sp. U87765 SZCCT0131]|uniref:DUF4870 family protein n=1 Tax=unclassified Bradyrhizobium TaxID=2631580 RepID=UPI001BAC58DD|nr:MULTISPECIES: DUF4870 domain-containing protein [unclassified Bradyrhizobium]MBR1220612.1 DUF4870 domain-containing protein [Bradyrhizobium sp. U87765 SZCCT0131]MBR1262934.1 DUF4870 domain-containing protein [Bradyrhizobium sp. U87765 SZCCT0134]MBR1307184.1 DUF4870 domain-containing protein [Bradyrhizobium sp. U87765 SZCCT0110]MBR1322929.1 DUF4870 domain-containing protein [Bradyrhizobium sp. U87765 SZCCT0109]MBR1346138.1 DUF4870 domain-containing protein [Bradyrhizobium sp. U87765 SZCCT004